MIELIQLSIRLYDSLFHSRIVALDRSAILYATYASFFARITKIATRDESTVNAHDRNPAGACGCAKAGAPKRAPNAYVYRLALQCEWGQEIRQLGDDYSPNLVNRSCRVRSASRDLPFSIPLITRGSSGSSPRLAKAISSSCFVSRLLTG